MEEIVNDIELESEKFEWAKVFRIAMMLLVDLTIAGFANVVGGFILEKKIRLI